MTFQVPYEMSHTGGNFIFAVPYSVMPFWGSSKLAVNSGRLAADGASAKNRPTIHVRVMIIHGSVQRDQNHVRVVRDVK